MDSVNSSEFGSEDEDAEFALYAKLYFEPNPELTNVDAVDGHLKGNVSDGILSNSSSHQDSLVNKTQNSLHVSPKAEPEVRAIKDNSYTEPSCKSSRTSGSVPVPLQIPRNMNEVKDKSIKAQPKVRRERLSSVCSIESISGSVALDDLYCNMMDTLDEEGDALADRLTNSTTSEGIDINSGKRMKPIKKKRSRKRESPIKKKRSRSLESSDEDSRCKSLQSLTSKNRKGGKKQKVDPTHVHFDTLDDNDSCKQKQKKGKKVDENIVCIDISDSSDTCILPQSLQVKPKIHGISKKKSTCCKIQNTCTNDISESFKPPKESTVFKQPRVVVKTRTDHNEKECLIKSKSFVTISSDGDSIPSDSDSITSDSDSDDIYEMPLETKLTMNFNKEFSSDVNKFGLDTNINFEQKKSFGKQETSKYTFDFTKRRRLSKRQPSCKNWTPEMTSFYDSDVSDEFSVEEVHSHQSSFKSDWNIISLDYRGAIFPRKRYYNQQDRCTRCRQFGHLVKECPRVPHCFICSATSHTRRNECPSNCCFRCGGPPHFYCHVTASAVSCPLCGNPGHLEGACPDLWRKYHLTTSGSVPVVPTSPVNLQTNKRRYCCMCGKRGHFGHECPLKYTIKSQYCIQRQIVITYNQPVNGNGESIINLEKVEASENVTKLAIDSSETGIVIGRGGTIIKSIQQQTGASMSVIEQKDSCYLQICGDTEAQALCRAAIEDVLGRRVHSVDSKSCALLRIMSKSRNKQSVIRIIRNRIKYYCQLRRKLAELPSVVEVLKEGQRLQLKENSPSPEFLENLEKSLCFASEMLVGHLKCGEGKSIFNYINSLLRQITKFNRRVKVPLFILEEIAHTFEKVDKPSIGKLDEILDLAETHLQTKDQQLNGSKNNTDNDMDIIEVESSSTESGKENDIVKIVRKRKKKLKEQSNFNEAPGFSGGYVKKKVLPSKRKVALQRKKKHIQEEEKSGIIEIEGFHKIKKKKKVMPGNRKLGIQRRKEHTQEEEESGIRETEGFHKSKKKKKSDVK